MNALSAVDWAFFRGTRGPDFNLLHFLLWQGQLVSVHVSGFKERGEHKLANGMVWRSYQCTGNSSLYPKVDSK